MTRSIWKFTKYVDDEVEVSVPKGAQFITVLPNPETLGYPRLDFYFAVDVPNQGEEPEQRRFSVYGTGFHLPDDLDLAKYVATVRTPPTVWHIFTAEEN